MEFFLKSIIEILSSCNNDGQNYAIASRENTQPQALAGNENDLTGIVNSGGNDCWAISLVQCFATIHSTDERLRRLSTLFELSQEPEKAYHTAELLESIRTLRNERESDRKLSVIDSERLRLNLSHICGSSPLTGEPLISLDRRVQVDASEVYIQLLTLHDELYRQNIHQCDPSLSPILEIPSLETKRFKILEYQDGKRNSQGRFLSAEDLFQLSSQDPCHNDAITTCDDLSFTKRTSTSLVQIEIARFKSLLLGLKNKKLEINHSPHLSPTQKEYETRKYEEAIFQQVIRNYFISPEAQGSCSYNILLNQVRQLALVKTEVTETRFLEAPRELMITLKKREYDDEGNQSKVCLKEYIRTEYGISEVLSEAKAPIFEKFTLPAEFIAEESTYEVDSFFIHHSDEFGDNGHYTSFQKVDGAWFSCDDEAVLRADDFLVKRALDSAYMLHYVKRDGVDPQAIKILHPQDDEAFIQQNEELLGELLTLSEFQRSMPTRERSSKIDLTSEEQVLNIAIDTIPKLTLTQDLLYFYSTLPSSILRKLKAAVQQKLVTVKEIQSLLSENFTSKGRALIDHDPSLIVAAFYDKYRMQMYFDRSFTTLNICSEKEKHPLESLLKEIEKKPSNIQIIKKKFSHPLLHSVRDQIREIVYLHSISGQYEKVYNQILIDEGLSILCQLLKSVEDTPDTPTITSTVHSRVPQGLLNLENEQNITRANFESLRAQMVLLTQVGQTLPYARKGEIGDFLKTLPDLIQNMINNEVTYLARSTEMIQYLESENHLKAGQDILDQNPGFLYRAFKNSSLLQSIYGRSFDTIDFASDKELSVYLDLVDKLKGIINEEKVYEIFYHPNFGSVRNQILELVHLDFIAQEIQEISSDILFQNGYEVIQQMIEAIKLQLTSCSSESPSNAQSATAFVDLREVLLQVIKCESSDQIIQLILSLPEPFQHQLRSELYSSVMKHSSSIAEMVKLDPVKSGRAILSKNILNLKTIYSSGEHLKRVLGKSNEINCSAEEEPDVNSLMLLILSDSQDEQAIRNLFYRSSISPRTRNRMGELVYLQQLSIVIDFEVTQILNNPDHLDKSENKLILLSALESLWSK